MNSLDRIDFLAARGDLCGGRGCSLHGACTQVFRIRIADGFTEEHPNSQSLADAAVGRFHGLLLVGDASANLVLEEQLRVIATAGKGLSQQTFGSGFVETELLPQGRRSGRAFPRHLSHKCTSENRQVAMPAYQPPPLGAEYRPQ